jgi:S-adenosylmethionine hydrolase
VHVVVVDPGVGSARRSILVEAERHFFIGPDNGVFSMIFDSVKHKVRAITNPKYMLTRISRTFHGRDVFAPAAAYLSKKTPPDRFGDVITDAVFTGNFRPEMAGPNRWKGIILKVDRFGNLIANLHVAHVGEFKTGAFELRIGQHKIHRLANTYAETEIGEVFVIVGSSGYLEIAAHQGNAAERLGCRGGAPIALELY